ncbi:hypothetical protein Lser_V15G27794 [Lactuca serriola]
MSTTIASFNCRVLGFKELHEDNHEAMKNPLAISFAHQVNRRTGTWLAAVSHLIAPGLTYTLIAHVGVSVEHPHLHLHGHGHGQVDVIATLKLEYHGSETKYMQIIRTSVSKERWEKLEGTFVLPKKPDRVVLYLEGPAPGVNILIESLVVTCATSHGIVERYVVKDENIILNLNFEPVVNSIEQLCIHYSNERLKQHHNRHLFKIE